MHSKAITSSKNNMIELKQLSKSYSSEEEIVEIFRDLNFAVPTGTFACVMGPSGSGKSTLLSLLSGLISPQKGSVVLDNTDLTNLSEDAITQFRGKNIAFIFQAYELIPNLTVEENIDLPVDINGVSRRFTTAEILDRVWLAGKGKRYPTELSGWEQQRVAVARAFVANVPYLLADEPTGNLDRKNANRIMDLIDELHAETGNTILMITHDLEVAKRADVLYELRDGKLIEISK